MKKFYLFVLVALFAVASQAQVKIGTTNYGNLKGAFDAINSGAKTGIIEIEITSDVTDNDAAALYYSGYGGTASYTSITIKPTGLGSRTVTVNNDIIFYGSNLTIDGDNRTTFKRAGVALESGCIWVRAVLDLTNITIKNCKVLGPSKGFGIFLEPYVANINNINIYNCEVSAADVAVPMRVGIYADSDYGGSVYNGSITSNRIHDYGSSLNGVVSAAIQLERAGKLTINQNKIYQSVARSYGNGYTIFLSGLVSHDSNDITSISSNQIGGSDEAGSGMLQVAGGNFRGINVKSTSFAKNTISYNTIRNVSIENTADSGPGGFSGIGVIGSDTQIIGNAIGSIQSPNSIVANFTNSVSGNGVTGITANENAACVVSGNTIGGISVQSTSTCYVAGIQFTAQPTFSPTNFTCTDNIVGAAVSNSITVSSTQHCELMGIVVDKNRRGLVTGNTVRSMTGNFPAYGVSLVLGINYTDSDYSGTERAISGNLIYDLHNNNLVGPTCVYGIQIYSTNGNTPALTIDNNKISGLYMGASTEYSTVTGLSVAAAKLAVRNNMIAVGPDVTGRAAVYGVQIRPSVQNDSTDKIITNNSLYVGGTNNAGTSVSAALNSGAASASTINMYDNILMNARTNAALASGDNYSVMYSGKVNMRSNVLYGAGSGYALAPFMDSLAQLASSVFSSNTQYFADPKFIAPAAVPANLHIQAVVPTIVESHAFSSSGTDIDGETRSALTPNDIGADAGNFIFLAPPTISSFSTNSICGPGAFNIIGTNLSEVTSVHIGSTQLPIYGTGNTTVTVLAPSADLSGTIKVENAVGAATSTQSMSIYATPSISAQPVPKTICPNQSTTFSVTATGAATYQWRRNGIALANNGNFSNVNTATLTITNANVTTAGQYDVVISGSSADCSVTSSAATLIIGSTNIALVPSGPTSFCAGESVTLTPMIHTPALQFDGIDDYVNINGANLGDFTMSFWIKTTQSGAPGSQWFEGTGIIDGMPTVNPQNKFGTALMGSKLAFGMNATGINNFTVLSNASINTGEWTHVAVTRSNISGELKIYINGNPDASMVTGYGGFELSNAPMRIGGSLSGNNYFNGALDDIKIYQRILSDGEIEMLKQGNAVTDQLFINFAMDENSGAQIANPNLSETATIMNGAQWIDRLAPATFQNAQWSTGQTTQSITVNQSGVYTFSGTGGSCQSPGQNSIVINVSDPQVHVNFTGGQTYCGSQPLQLDANGADTYSWTPAEGLSATTGTTVYASPAATTTYTVTGVNANGCQASQVFTVVVQQPTPLTVMANANYIEMGQTATLTVSGGSGLRIWSPATGLNTTFGDTVMASPNQTTTYIVSGLGCEIPQSITIYVLPAASATDNALNFDGIDDYVDMPIQTQGISGTFTVAVWVKPGHPTKNMHLLSSRNGANGNTFDIQIKDGNKIHGDIGNGTDWLTTAADATFQYQANQWMHIAYKITPGQYKIFVNGNLIQTGSYPGTAVLYNNDTNFITLGKNNGEDTLLQGTIDDLMISSVDFPDAFMANAPRFGIPAQIRYSFDEGIAGGTNPTVTILRDQNVQSGMHGTLHEFNLNGTFSNWVVGQSAQQQTIAMATQNSIVYTATYTPSATASSGLPITYQSSDPSIASVSGNLIMIHGIGTVTILAEQPGNAFFDAAPPQGQMLTITPKALAIANATAQNKVYDRNTAASITGTLTGILGTDQVSFAGIGTFASSNIGNAIAVTSYLSLTGADAAKYTLNQPVGLVASITPKTVTVSGAVAADKVYDGTTLAAIISSTLNGVISPDAVYVGSNAGTFASPNVGNNIAVTSQLTLMGASATNYVLTQPVGLSANITPRSLTAAISGSATICVGQSTALQVAISGNGLFTVAYTDGTSIYMVYNYSSGNNIMVAPVSTAAYTLVAVTASNAQVALSGSATVTISGSLMYADADGDGFGNAEIATTSCTGVLIGYVLNNTDCDDTNAAIHQTFMFYLDSDHDTYGAGNLITVCAINATTPPFGYSLVNTDCAPNDATIWRTGSFYVDADNDGYYNGNPETTLMCYGVTVPSGYVDSILGTDCNDANAAANPNYVEIAANGIDDNCDGSIDEAGPAITVIASQCGITLANIANTIYSNQAAGALGYRFEVANGSNIRTSDSPTNSFSLMSLPGGVTYGTTYSIRVAVKMNGFWRTYATACNITTPERPAVSNVIASQCGTTLSNIGNIIYANQVTAANQYRFEVTDVATAVVRTFDTGVNRFSLSSLAGGGAFGATYSIRVSLRFDATWEPYGTACNVSTPATPATTSLQASQCNITIGNQWTTLYATQVPSAQGYRFRVTNGATVRFVDRIPANFALAQIGGAPLAPNTAYMVEVAVLYNSVYGAFGPACTITTTGVIIRHANAPVAIFEVKSYPNPFADTFKLEINTSSEDNVRLKVYDMIGKLVECRDINVSELGTVEVGRQYSSGVYNVFVTQGEKVETLRVIKR